MDRGATITRSARAIEELVEASWPGNMPYTYMRVFGRTALFYSDEECSAGNFLDSVPLDNIASTEHITIQQDGIKSNHLLISLKQPANQIFVVSCSNDPHYVGALAERLALAEYDQNA